MGTTVTYHFIRCDECNRAFNDGYAVEDLSLAEEQGWILGENSTICPDCSLTHQPEE